MQHVGVHVARVDGVDPDRLGREGERQVMHEPGHLPLGQRVPSAAWPLLVEVRRPLQHGGDRAGRDDRGARPQMRIGRGDQVHHAKEVDVHRVEERAPRQAGPERADARVGNHDVEPPQLGHTAVDRRAQLRGSRTSAWNVTARRSCSSTSRLVSSRSAGRGQRVLHVLDVGADVNRDDVRARPRQRHRVAAALPARGAGDDRDFAVELAHVSALRERDNSGGRPELLRKSVNQFNSLTSRR